MTTASKKRVLRHPLRLYLLDAHPVARLGLRAFFDRHPSIIVSGDATTLAASLPDLRRCKPDVLITDSFPIPKRVLGRLPALRVLYTLESLEHCSLARLLEDLAHGQAGFALKSLSLDRLLKAVRQVAAGRKYRDPAFMRLVNAEQQQMKDLSPRKQRLQPASGQDQKQSKKRRTKRRTQAQRMR